MDEKTVLVVVSVRDNRYALGRLLPELESPSGTCAVSLLIVDDSVGNRRSDSISEEEIGRFRHCLQVLRSEEKLGFGGCCKVGYQYATEMGFGAVSFLSNPEDFDSRLIGLLAEPVLKGHADVSFPKSRTSFSWGSRILAGILNPDGKWYRSSERPEPIDPVSAMMGNRSVYSVSALARVPLARNSDDEKFEVELMIQALTSGLSVAEVSVPESAQAKAGTGRIKRFHRIYGTALESCLHRMGVFYNRKFDFSGATEVDYDLKLGYCSSHTMVLDAVPKSATVLDVGCGPGHFGALLREKGCLVRGLDRNQCKTQEGLDGFVQVDLDWESLGNALEGCDHILLMDIIEHLDNPERVLEEIRNLTGHRKPRVLITVPNVGFFLTRLRLLFGGFHYGPKGILDFTHRRLFTLSSLCTMLDQCGYRVRVIKGVPAPYPKALGNNRIAHMLVTLNSAFIRLSLGLFSYQIYVDAFPLPTPEMLLMQLRHSDGRRPCRPTTEPKGGRLLR